MNIHHLESLSQKFRVLCPLCGAKPIHLSIVHGEDFPLARWLIECTCVPFGESIQLSFSWPLSEEERQTAFKDAKKIVKNLEFLVKEEN